MARAVYLTALGPASGKSLVALGVVELLSHRVDRVGFFRPVVSARPDNDIELIRVHFDLPADRVGHAFTADDLRAVVTGRPDEHDVAMAEVVAAFKAIEARCDFAVIEGTDFTGPASPLEYDVNVRVARDLGAPVVAVVNGHDRGAVPIVQAVGVGEESLARRGVTVAGLVVNRVPPGVLDEVVALLGQRPAPAPPAWAVPEEDLLRLPTLAELGRALGAEVVVGEPADLDRAVRHVKVAAMSVPNLLSRIEDSTVLIAPGDRPDVLVTAALSRVSAAVPGVAGVLLSGGLRPDPRVAALIAGLTAARPLPMLAVRGDSFETATAASALEGPITAADARKVDVALALFETHVDVDRLADHLAVARSSVVTPVMFQHDLIERARRADAHIVLPEGADDRVLQAADRLVRRQVCGLTVLGSEPAVRHRAAVLGLVFDDVAVVDPESSPWVDEFAERYAHLRRHKGVTVEGARDHVMDVSVFGTMMVHTGRAGGMVSGAAHTTAHTVRPALEIIRPQPGISIVSSVFLMLLADRVLVFGDCAINPDPDASQLADIAISSAATAELFGVEPRVAMLSYSTGASGRGSDVDKVREATELVRARRPEIPVAGPIQYDAAVDPEVGRAKLPGSDVAGRATVLVFPDLNTGNNTYKAVQRSGGAVAVGPVLQGLNAPVNDLSRGATVADIVNTVAITAIQAGRT